MNSAPSTATAHTRPTLASARITVSRSPRELFHSLKCPSGVPRRIQPFGHCRGPSESGLHRTASVAAMAGDSSGARPRRARRPGHHGRSSTDRTPATPSTAPPRTALADAFRAFDADEGASVAVLYGEGGTFCAGADLKAIGTERGQPGAGGRGRPDGADPAAARQAGDRRDRGVRRRRWPRARDLVRPPGRRQRREARGLLPPLGGAPHRRRHGPAAPAGRHRPGAGPGPHRAAGRRRGGAADRPGRPRRGARPGASGGRGARPPARASCPRTACARTGSPCSSRRGCPRRTRWPTSCATGSTSLQCRGARGRAAVRVRRGPARRCRPGRSAAWLSSRQTAISVPGRLPL